MSLDLLKPVSDSLIDELNENYLQGSIYKKLAIHTSSFGLPNLESTNVCIVGLDECRNSFFQSATQDLERSYTS